ncbi:MAG: hypothetical protein M5R42_15265 [Rhodocyclaceae bacterium]|nr:hypothetical protein [Rhodocyclaceae bacterium]
MSNAVAIHPAIDAGIKPAAAGFAGGKLYCKCPSDKVEVTIGAQTAHNHACGCSKCWKPAGALFSQVAVVSRDKVAVTAHPEKLKGHRQQCRHPAPCLHRLRCVHCSAASRTRRTRSTASTSGTPSSPTAAAGRRPSSAAFVSSIIETGTDPAQMPAVRARLKALGLEPYDCLSPALMDAISTHVAKNKAA